MPNHEKNDDGLCKDCLFWDQNRPDKNGQIGTCKRYPPVIVGRQSISPETHKMDWCGEFKGD